MTKCLTDLSIRWPKDIPPAAAAKLSNQQQLVTASASKMLMRMEALEKKMDGVEERVERVESEVQVGIVENTSTLRRLKALLLGQYQQQQLPPAHTQQQQLPAPPIEGAISQRTSSLAVAPMLRFPSSNSSTSPFLFSGEVMPLTENESIRQISKPIEIETSTGPAGSSFFGPGPAALLTSPQGREGSAVASISPSVVQQPSPSSTPAPVVSGAPSAATSKSPASSAAPTSASSRSRSHPAAELSPAPSVETADGLFACLVSHRRAWG